MEMFTLTPEGMGAAANQVKDSLLAALVDEGIITGAVGGKIQRTWIISVIKRSWISTIFRSKDDNVYKYVVSKILIDDGTVDINDPSDTDNTEANS